MNSKLNSYFNPDAPPIDLPCVVLAKDEGGEYRLPYPCVWRGDAWYALGNKTPRHQDHRLAIPNAYEQILEPLQLIDVSLELDDERLLGGATCVEPAKGRVPQ